MHSLVKITALFLLFAAAGGCRQGSDPGPPNMMPKILGALQIRDARERDAALAAACREAAEQGSGPAVLMGIPRIEESGLHDDIAQECAVTLGDLGQTEAAVEVARLISDQPRRDELLAKLGAEPSTNSGTP
jgi:hypothetical protein